MVTNFTIDYLKEEEAFPMPVVSDPTKLTDLIDPEEVVIPAKAFSILVNYPLRNSAIFQFDPTPHAVTRRQLYSMIQYCYALIYSEPIKYGVWGHEVGDLYIEGCTWENDGTLTLTMGS